jgi:hypothetical protein
VNIHLNRKETRRIKRLDKTLIRCFSFWATFHGNAVNRPVVKPQGYKNPAPVTVTVFFWHPYSIPSPWLCTRTGIVVAKSALHPKQPGMLFAKPNKGGDHLPLVN